MLTEAPGTPVQRFCHACGVPLDPQGRFCGQCGTPRLGIPVAPPAPVAAPRVVTRGRRLAATAIDLALLAGIFVGAVFVMGFILGATEDPAAPVSDATLDQWTGYVMLCWLAVCVVYHPLLETVAGATWGKQMVGLRSVRMDGARLTGWHAIGHQVARLVTLATLGLGELTILVTAERRALHDLIAGTRSERC